MIATIPASMIVKNRPWRTGVAGTIWNGEAGIAGGSVLKWHWAPLRSLTSFGFAFDWHAAGANTDLGGRGLMKLGGRVVLDKISGSADATLLKALQPNLPFTCAMTMQVEMPEIAVHGGTQRIEGRIATDPGSCAPTSAAGAAAPVPALLMTAEPIGDETRIRVTPMTQRRRTLVDAILHEDGTLKITMTRAGADALPFAGVPGGASIEASF